MMVFANTHRQYICCWHTGNICSLCTLSDEAKNILTIYIHIWTDRFLSYEWAHLWSPSWSPTANNVTFLVNLCYELISSRVQLYNININSSGILSDTILLSVALILPVFYEATLVLSIWLDLSIKPPLLSDESFGVGVYHFINRNS